MDYETFGEHQGAECGIFDFMRAFTDLVAKDPELEFVTPSKAATKHHSVGEDAFHKLYELEEKLSLADDEALWTDYGHLQESDHFYYMCTKFFSDGEIHSRFNPYATPYEAFINYMNVLSDFSIRLDNAIAEKK